MKAEQLVREKKFDFSDLTEGEGRTFTPLRYFISIDDKHFNTLFVSGFDNEETRPVAGRMIEDMFSINCCFPSGFHGPFNNELGKTIGIFDIAMLMISYIEEISIHESFKEFISDLRLSIQNFLYFIRSQSYYSAFGEYRKIIESVIGIDNAISRDSFEFDSVLIFQEGYSSRLKDIEPKMDEAGKLFVKTIHPEKIDKIIVFNTNMIYATEDGLTICTKSVQDTSELVVKGIDKLISHLSVPSNPQTSKLNQLYKILKMHWDQPYYNGGLQDLPIVPGYQRGFPNGFQEVFEKAVTTKKINPFRRADFLQGYQQGLRHHLRSTHHVGKYSDEEYAHGLIILNKIPIADEVKVMIHNIFGMCSFVSKNSLETGLDWKTELRSLSRRKFFKKQIHSLFDHLSGLFSLEFEMGKSKTLAIFRSLTEEFLVNIEIGKTECYPILFFLFELAKRQLPDLESEFINASKKHRHIVGEGRIGYAVVSNILEPSVTGGESFAKEYVDEVVSIIGQVISEIRKHGSVKRDQA